VTFSNLHAEFVQLFTITAILLLLVFEKPPILSEQSYPERLHLPRIAGFLAMIIKAPLSIGPGLRMAGLLFPNRFTLFTERSERIFLTIAKRDR
jgi:hypothetical protein